MDRPLNGTPMPNGALGEQMRVVLNLLHETLPQMARADAIFWLVQQRYGNSPLIQRMGAQVKEHILARLALEGLIVLVLEEGASSPEVLMGIARAISQLITSHTAIQQTWQQFLQTSFDIAQDPLVQRGMQEMREFGAWHEQLYQPAVHLYQTVTRPER